MLAPPAPPPLGVAPARASYPLRPVPSQRRLPAPRAVSAATASHAHDAIFLRRAADVADQSAGLTSPHPNFGCVIARPQLETENLDAWVAGEGFLYAQGTPCAELLAAEQAGEHARGATAYLNLEPGDCYGDSTAVSSLVQAGITRVVVGLRHPLKHLRGKAIQSLRSEGIQVDVVGEDLQSKLFKEALTSCLIVNAPLLYRAAFRVPFSVLKYAMTADGKIAASSGHASWVSGRASRCRVFELRGRSDAVIVGGNTVRRDDPRLTARHVKGHVPVRIVMSQTCNLPEEANLWNVHEAYTIVATQRGARRDFQKKLAMKGVEVVEFDMLNPRDVMSYCYDRGYLSVLWECGGTLSAAAICARVIHKVYAFCAPKIIGGVNAPTPVGELGMNQMTQAIDLIDVSYEQIDRDMLMSGFIQPIPDLSPVIPSVDEIPSVDPEVSPYETNIISFYKTWDTFGAFSNFSPHPIHMPDEKGDCLTWPTVEHYYQIVKSGEKIGLKHFKPVKPLGCGDTGSVHLVELQGSGELFAMKAMDKSVMLNRNKVHRAIIEREIYSLLDHPFLPTLYTSFQTPTHICLITDFCPGGELFAALDKQPLKIFREESARFYAAEVVIGLEYLHCLGIIYRDLKPENILLQEDGHVVLTDFDLSFLTSSKPHVIKHSTSLKRRRSKEFFRPSVVSDPSTPSNSFVGTEEYIAPEVITGAGHTSAIDWWALGILLYEMLYGRTPFRGKNRKKTFYNILHKDLTFPSSIPVSLEAKQLIHGLLQRDPSARIGSNTGANDIKEHPFFEDIYWPLIRCMSPPELDVPLKPIGKETLPQAKPEEGVLDTF